MLALEKHYGSELGESLISAVQFSREGDPPRARRVAATGRGDDRPGRAGPPTASPSTACLTPAGSSLISRCCRPPSGRWGFGAYAVASTEVGSIWWDRVRLEDRPWPQDTYLEVQYAEDGVLSIPRGDDWPLVISVKEGSKRKPDQVVVDFISENGARRTETMEVEEKQQRFRIDLRSVIEPFQFRAPQPPRAGVKRPLYQAVLVARPEPQELTITKTLPEYAGGGDEELPPRRRGRIMYSPAAV